MTVEQETLLKLVRISFTNDDHDDDWFSLPEDVDWRALAKRQGGE